MFRDRFDGLMIVALGIVLLSTGLLMSKSPAGRADQAGVPDPNLEREILSQARLAYIERHYSPVVRLRDQGALQQALLKLEELGRRLPGEAHNDLLGGDILLRMGQYDRALPRLAAAVRKNADYVDAASPLSQRALLESAVASALPLLRDRLRSQPESRNLEQVVRDGYYLQSRLAGGCE